MHFTLRHNDHCSMLFILGFVLVSRETGTAEKKTRAGTATPLQAVKC